MIIKEDILNRLFRFEGEHGFNELALDIFHFQYESNPVYHEFADLLGIKAHTLSDPSKVPFLPISFFKNHRLISGKWDTIDRIFTSSGTTGSIPSSHYIHDIHLYRESFLRSFTLFYGDPENYRFLVLLPGYLERKGSSLVYMMEEMVSLTKENGSGFFLHDLGSLEREIAKPVKSEIKTILFGASYALLDFAGSTSTRPLDAIIMETGGMKGRNREMIREELHGILCRKFGVETVHSEYGMTELLSQAYSRGKGLFLTPPWMKVLIRDINDPVEILPPGKTGGINIIDLANLYSCAFIATQDLGRVHEDGSFEVLGRFDDSDVRGCNLMVV